MAFRSLSKPHHFIANSCPFMGDCCQCSCHELVDNPFTPSPGQHPMITDPRDLPPDVPFSLSCCECDAENPDTLEEALAAGWTEITHAPDLPMANFVGYCPEHSLTEPADHELGDETAG